MFTKRLIAKTAAVLGCLVSGALAGGCVSYVGDDYGRPSYHGFYNDKSGYDYYHHYYYQPYNRPYYYRYRNDWDHDRFDHRGPDWDHDHDHH